MALVASALVLLPSAARADADADAPSQPQDAAWTDANGLLVEEVSAGDSQLHGRWTPSEDTVGVATYRVELAQTPDFATVLAVKNVSAPTTAVTFTAADGVQTSKSYYFRVRAADAAGNNSTWSAPSNRVTVRQDETGAAIAHAPVLTAFYGQPVPIEVTATCETPGLCTARVLYRTTTSAPALLDNATWALDGGFTAVELTSGEATSLNGQDAIAYAGEIPGAAVTTAGVDYFIEAEDGAAVSVFPGTPFVGTSNTPGVQGAGSYIHVHTVNPPLLAHQPPPYGRGNEPIDLTLQASCSTSNCTATLHYRTTDDSIVTTEAVQTSNGELLADPGWPTATMTQSGTPTSLGDAGKLITFTARIPGSYAKTKGVDYFFHVSDGHTEAWSPGTTYEGHYAPLDGMRTGYWHLRVLEPTHLVHVQPATAGYRTPLEISAQANCPTGTTCDATLYYRTTTASITEGPSTPVPIDVGNGNGTYAGVTLTLPSMSAGFDSSPMTITRTPGAEGVDVIEAKGTIPATALDTRGVDYFFSISDGSTTAWWPGTTAVDGYAVTDGTQVGYSHVRVLEPPHFLHVPPLTAAPLQDLTISTDLTCATEACTANLTYTVDPDAGPAKYVTVAMARTAVHETTPIGRRETWAATIPASKVTTRGVSYYMRAFDGYTRTAAPGTFYWGAYVPIDGTAVNGAEATLDGESGVHAAAAPGAVVMYPVRVLEPPHLVSIPPVPTEYGTEVPVEGFANCATAQCVATLHWRTVDHRWNTAPMTSTLVTPPAASNSLHKYRAVIPAAAVTPEGLDYWIELTDGYVATATPTWRIAVPNGRQTQPYAPVADTFVSTKQCTAPTCPPANGGATTLSVGRYLSGVTTVNDETLVRYDVSDIPAGHRIVRATLQVPIVSNDQPLTVLSVKQVTSAWNEATVRYPTRPTYAASELSHVLVATNQSVALDVTDAVAAWTANLASNNGLVLLPNATITHKTTVASRESTATVGAPTIEITHVATDVQAPTAALTAPAPAATLAGTTTLSATATDDTAVRRVDFVVDDVVIGSDTSSPYSTPWDTNTIADGPHSVWVRAVDSSGNVGPSERAEVFVKNDVTAPTVTINAAAAGEAVYGDITIDATASDNRSVSRVDFLVDNAVIASLAQAPYVVAWSTLSVPDGAHDITVRAVDPSGNEAITSPRAVTVVNEEGPPIFPTVRPQGITANTATPVVVTVRGRGEVTGAVEVLDASSTVIASLTDNGAGPDMVNGDNVFSGQVSLTSAGATVPLRVRMTVDGATRVSSPTVVEVAPAGIPNDASAAELADPVVDPTSHSRYVNNELLVGFEAGTTYAQVTTAVNAAGGTIAGRLPGLGTWQIRVPDMASMADLDSRMDLIANQPPVESVEPNELRTTTEYEPDDDRYDEQWAPEAIRADETWVVNRGGGVFVDPSVHGRYFITVAVVDTGVDYNHPDLDAPGKVITDFDRDSVDDDDDAMDDNYHGTSAAGIIGAETNNDEGIAGIDWHTKILPERVCKQDGDDVICPDSAIIDGITHAVDSGVTVISVSLGGGDRSENEVKALAYANQANIPVVISAGNKEEPDDDPKRRFGSEAIS